MCYIFSFFGYRVTLKMMLFHLKATWKRYNVIVLSFKFYYNYLTFIILNGNCINTFYCYQYHNYDSKFISQNRMSFCELQNQKQVVINFTIT